VNDLLALLFCRIRRLLNAERRNVIPWQKYDFYCFFFAYKKTADSSNIESAASSFIYGNRNQPQPGQCPSSLFMTKESSRSVLSFV